MSMAAHHGPPGSYKTFTLVQRHAIEALKAGRVVVTNIRGFNDIQLIIDEFTEFEFPDTAKIIFVDTKTKDGLFLLAQWFHWVPFGALILIDEAQAVYPQRSDFKIERLDNFVNDYGLDIEQTFNNEPRPRDMYLAFDMHRHFGWDLFLSTPNIAKIHKVIRQSMEWAYKHRDISGLLPWYKGMWAEVQHDPESSGKSITSRVGVPVKNKANPRIFNCYASTATGDHKGSDAGRSVLKDPKILAICFTVIICIIVFFSLLFSTTNSIASVKTDNFPHSESPDFSSKGHTVAPSVASNSSSNFFKPIKDVSIESAGGSDLERTTKRAIEILLKLDFKGFVTVDDELPTTCTYSKKGVYCPISFVSRHRFTNTYCTDVGCYVLLMKQQKINTFNQPAVSYSPSFGLT